MVLTTCLKQVTRGLFIVEFLDPLKTEIASVRSPTDCDKISSSDCDFEMVFMIKCLSLTVVVVVVVFVFFP